MAEILHAIAALLWPIIVILIIFILVIKFKPAIAAIIESAKSRKFTLKLGGQELTMEEANEQQRNVITDIQSQLLELKDKTQGKTGVAPSPISPTTKSLGKSLSILWVDDNPKNNSYYVQQLTDMGFTVDSALSSSEGYRRFKEGHYSFIISGMGRQMKNYFDNTAGLDLLREIRYINQEVPFVIFTTSGVVREYAAKAQELGATHITASWTDILGILQKELV